MLTFLVSDLSLVSDYFSLTLSIDLHFLESFSLCSSNNLIAARSPLFLSNLSITNLSLSNNTIFKYYFPPEIFINIFCFIWCHISHFLFLRPWVATKSGVKLGHLIYGCLLCLAWAGILRQFPSCKSQMSKFFSMDDYWKQRSIGCWVFFMT